jgi:signal transduction histidine kinase
MATALRHVHTAQRARDAASENEQMRRMLIQNEKLASLGEISAGLVHELSNPLTSIVAYTDYLRQKAERRGSDPEDVERLRRVGEAANLILSFTRAIISYARPATEPPTTVAINEVVEQAFVFCKHFVDQSGITVQRNVRGDLPRVRAVRGQLTQVVVNLVTNACQAMDANGGDLVLEATLDPNTNLLVLRVSDNGPGIDMRDLPHVFDPFFTTKSAGTGLGLSIVRQIVERHGGRVSVDSAPGQGATFTVSLPAAD